MGAYQQVIGAFIEGMGEIDPTLITRPERAVRRARNVCYDIVECKPPATVVENARKRYDGGHTTVDTAMAARIIEVIRTSGFLDLYRRGELEPAPELIDLLPDGELR